MRGHTGNVGNERADRLAAQGRRQALGLAPAGEPVPSPAVPAVVPPPGVAAEAPAPAPRTTPVAIDLGLGLDVSRAAKLGGLTPQAFVERAIRVALKLGPDGIARVLDGGSAKP